MTVIPEPSPIPLPAPPGLLSILLYLTFLLHLIPMNLTVAGLFYLVLSEARRSDDPIAHWVRSYLPASTALTITTGVAPLLFVQVLYGRLFFTATVLMAWSWFSVIPFLLIGYAVLYYYLNRRQDLRSPWLAPAISLVLFLYVAFLFANVTTLMSSPSKWLTVYRSDPSGWNLNLDDPTLIPRSLHLIFGALAVFGLVTAVYGATFVSSDADRVRSFVSIGSRWFVTFTLLNFVIGPLFLFAHPREIGIRFLGTDAEGTGLLIVSVLAALGAVFLTFSFQRSRSKKVLMAAGALLTVTLIAMGRIRFLVRQWMIGWHAPNVTVTEIPAQPDWIFFSIFVIALAIGLVTVLWVVHYWFRSVAEEVPR